MADTTMLSDEPDNSISFASDTHAESDSDYESAAEVEGLPSLKPVVIMNKFLHDSDQVISARFIDAAYPERNFNNIKAPPELVGLITDLLPILPRRPDPIGDGVDYAERILSRTRRIKALRKDSDAFANVALQFWTDIKNDRTASKQIAVPGTAAHLYLQGVLEEVRNFRRFIYSMVNVSLVKRSTKRNETQRELGQAVQRLRKLTRDARKRLGLAHKVQSIALRPTPIEQKPMLSFSFPRRLARSTMLSALKRYRQDADSLYTDFPDLYTLQPFFFFFRSIFLEPHAMPLNQDPHSESAKVASTISRIRIECRADRLTFSNVTQLNAWKNWASRRIHRWTLCALNGLDIFKTGKPILTLELMVITFCCAGYWTEAATLAELLVIAHRDFFQYEKSTVMTQLSFCNAVGVLALCLLHSRRPQEAVLAIENAMSVLRPLHKTHPFRTMATISHLRIVNSRALLALSKKSANDAIKLYLVRKARDTACLALPGLDQLSLSGTSFKVDCKSAMFHALRARTEASQALRKLAATLQLQHGKAIFCVTTEAGKPTCCASLSLEESHFVHRSVPGLNATGLPPSAQQSLDILRALAKEQPVFYEPMLADALVWKAEYFADSVDLALNLLREAEAIYKRLTETFYNHFGKQLVHMYTLMAARCIRTNRTPEAQVALAEGSRHQGLLIHKPNSVLWRGYDVAASLASAHASALSQLGEHRAALERATTAERAIRALHHDYNEYGPYLAEAMFAKGIAELMLYEPSKALIQLTGAMQLLQGPTKDNKRKCERTPGYLLAMAWRGATRKALGDVEAGRKEVDQALKLLRALLQETKGERHTCSHVVNSVEAMEPLFLTLLAVFALDTDPHQAIAKAQEALALVRTISGRTVDPQTQKTALQVQAHALNVLERPLEAAQIELAAELVPQQGFLHKLQCEMSFDEELTVRVEANARKYLEKGPPPSEE